jgi:hypothetical protein
VVAAHTGVVIQHAINPLVQHCIIRELNIPSYRIEYAKPAQTRNAEETTGAPPSAAEKTV